MNQSPPEEQPTQVKRPLRATIRTTLAAIVGFLPILPTVAKEFGLVEALPWMAGVLAMSAAVTRILATPQAEKWLETYFPWLTANEHNAGKHRKDHDHER